ncbi:hypothetical protein HPB48_004588 [Haemaphysalis longicornis]|uniref:Cytochrome P450 n=1 Tax=Haemaphysalis longicornis TaxID=44386 RepID=A0A9J6FET4_HAELO|nr:hypothetical protein HPB48_004588 [Haemaphysalis longicornis]
MAKLTTGQYYFFVGLPLKKQIPERLLNIGMERLSKPWLWWNPTYNLSSQKRAFARAAKDLNSFVMKVIRTRKQILSQNDKSDQPVHSSGYSKAFLDVLLKHHLEDATLSEEDIIEEVNTFLFAGHETTAVGLTFLLYILGLHPDVQKKVVEEIDLIFDGDFERDVTREDVSCMKYLDCVMKESQRIFTILPIYGRELEEDIHIGKYTVPRGSTCVILGQMLTRTPRTSPIRMSSIQKGFCQKNPKEGIRTLFCHSRPDQGTASVNTKLSELPL